MCVSREGKRGERRRVVAVQISLDSPSLSTPNLFFPSLAAIKKIPLQQRTKAKIFFEPTEEGMQDYRLYFMCDSYIGCDQEYDFKLKVAKGEEESDEEESEEEESGSEAEEADGPPAKAAKRMEGEDEEEA